MTTTNYGKGNVYKRGDVWFARFWSRVENRQLSRTTGTRDKREAEAILKQLIADDRAKAAGYITAVEAGQMLEAGAPAAPKPAIETPSISALLGLWIDERKPSDGTIKVYKGLWRHLEDFAKSRRIGRSGLIDKDFAKAYYQHCLGKYSVVHAATHVELPRHVWDFAIKQGVLTGLNPWQFKVESGMYESHKTLSAEDVAKILDKAKTTSEDLYLLCLVGLRSGMRISDASGLRWDSVDLGESPRFHFVPIKTRRHHKTEVTVPILDPELLELLRNREHTSDYVFPFYANTTRAYSEIRPLFDSVGLGKGYSFHSFRHTFVTDLREQGVSLETIASMTGHASTTMTMRYGVITERSKVEAIRKLDSGRNARLEALVARLYGLSDSQLEAVERLIG